MSFSSRLFRAHIAARPDERGAFAEILFLQRHAEVGQIPRPVGIQKNIARFDISVKYAVQVRVMHGVGDLADQ